MYQSIALDLAVSLREMTENLEKAFHFTFFLAAYLEVTSQPLDQCRVDPDGRLIPELELVNYEDVRLPSGGMSIRCSGVSMAYPRQSKATLRDINLSLEAGQSLAIVGLNGGGKTTLIKTLMGLYECEGDFTINGVAGNRINPRSLHERTSCLFQDFCKYSMTFRDNVGVGDVYAVNDDEAVLRAVKEGGADGVLARMRHLDQMLSPDHIQGAGADTTLPPKWADMTWESLKESVTAGSAPSSDSTRRLSGGQWQRIALARAFLRAKRADLVVFE